MLFMKKRVFSLDFCRVLAVLSIISNHALNTIFDAGAYAYWNQSPLSEKVFTVVGYIFSRVGVPLFLMITGALILSKKFETGEDITKFYKHNLIPLIVTVEIWNIIYYFFSMFLHQTNFDLNSLIYILLFMKNSTFPHMWYMPMIIGIYLFLPLVSMAMQKLSLKSIKIPLIVVILASFILPNLQCFLQFFRYDALYIHSILDLSFGGGVYGVYIILGYYIFREKVYEKISLKWLILGCIVCFAGSCIFQIIGYIHNSNDIVYYNFIGILLFGICIFTMILKLKDCAYVKIKNLITYLSRISLGLYFVHRPILFIFEKFVSLPFSNIVTVLIYYIFSILLSIAIIFVISKVKFLSEKLLLIK